MKNKFLTVLLLIFIYQVSDCQIIDVDYSDNDSLRQFQEEVKEPIDPFGRSFIDLFNNGKIQGTAQLLKLRIGEPSKFYIPFYIFLGASGDGLGGSEKNENTLVNLLNPIGGLLNGSFNGRNNLYKSTSGITSLKLAYQLSGKLINAQDSITENSKFIGTAYGNLGLFFQTGAWEKGKDDIGIFWIQTKITSSFGISKESLIEVFGSDIDKNYFIGYSLDIGLEIDNRVNLKAGLYQYLNNQEIELFSKPVFKFSLDYNLTQ